ncbi:hypothetical protein [Actinobacillus pleuropneumoniae]|uniref:Transposase n=1 Tax=Actinobacillus pleuropneumoniae serotype 3 (strain JL03) TaxID=434271 RepID=B0BTE8_ACTPJ|nr:hypothetical protein APJL_1912 [Actinobacillus pleuropneumoniae serovar 3 str. JL03]MBD4919234.1 hypothetical protein [Xanthomonas citri pv. citri]VTR22054.1 Uncharacterised protein [Actinobacillus pleuropneumoniae]
MSGQINKMSRVIFPINIEMREVLMRVLNVIWIIFLLMKNTRPELNIEKTTNRLEGLFSELKRKLNNHNGLSKSHKVMFIKDFLNKKSG